MKRTINKLISLVLSIVFLVNTTVFAAPSEVGADEQDMDSLMLELGEIQLQLQVLKESNSEGEYDEEIVRLREDINIVRRKIELCGADTPDSPRFQEVFTNADYLTNDKSKTIVDSMSSDDLANLISMLKNDYIAYGRTSTYSDGNKDYKIYEIEVANLENNSLSGRKLTTTEYESILYGQIKPNSSEAEKWISEIISVYVQRGVSAIIDKIPGVCYLPYELIFSSKPTADKISFSGNGLVAKVSTNQIVKFTYVLNEDNNRWVYCTSSNAVNSTLRLIATRFPSGGYIKDYDETYIINETGGYEYSRSSAVSVFKSMKSSSYNISPANLGIRVFSYKTIYKGDINIALNNISSPKGLI